MNEIYAFIDDSVLSEIKPIIEELITKDLRIKCFSFRDEQTSAPNLLPIPDCVLVFFCKSSQSINQASQLAQYYSDQHIKIIPLFSGTNDYLQNLPEILSSLHILISNDPSIVWKVVFSLSTKSEDIEDFNNKIQVIHKLWENGERANLTAKQLFYYAVALLYGIGVEKDYSRSICLQMCLIGNESFDPQKIILDVIPRKSGIETVMEYGESLKQYIQAKTQKILQTDDFRETEKLLSYGYLLKDLGNRFLYGYHVDAVLQDLNRISSLKCKNDPSVKAGLWTLQYYWETAVREADNRYHDKMLDCLLYALLLADKILKEHNDFDIKRHLFQAATVLSMYNSLRPQLLYETLYNKVLDTFDDDNTFRPPHKTKRRSKEEVYTMLYLLDKYAANRNTSISLFFTEEDYCFKQNRLLKMIFDAVDLLILCKANCVEDYISVWFQNNFQVLADTVPTQDQNMHLKLLGIYSEFLQTLLHTHYRTSPDALIYAALHMNDFYDRYGDKFAELSLDKSEIYATLSRAYGEQKNYERQDYYMIKLFEIVSVRDYDNSEIIQRMLVQCNNTAVERFNQSLYDQGKRLIEFGWKCCKSYDPLPEWLEEAFTHYQNVIAYLGIQ